MNAEVIGQIGSRTFVVALDEDMVVLVQDGEVGPTEPGAIVMKFIGSYIESVSDQDGAQKALDAVESAQAI